MARREGADIVFREELEVENSDQTGHLKEKILGAYPLVPFRSVAFEWIQAFDVDPLIRCESEQPGSRNR